MQCTQNDFIYGETGRTPLQTKRYMNIIKYWLKVTSSRNHKFIQVTYDLLVNDLNDFPNKTNWASQVRDTLFNLGFKEVWYNQSVGNEAIFLFTLKQRLTYIFIQNRNARLNSQGELYFIETLIFSVISLI